jgi:hypothetical protein
VIEHYDGQPERAAEPGVETGLAGERHRIVLKRHVTQIERLPDRKKSDEQQPINLARGRQEQRALHRRRLTLSGKRCANHHGRHKFAMLVQRQMPAAARQHGDQQGGGGGRAQTTRRQKPCMVTAIRAA